MNFLQNTGLLSGFDPQNKLVTLSYVLRSLLAAYARVNNRLVGETLVFRPFSTISATDLTIHFLLPAEAKKVMLWSLDYKLVSEEAVPSDCLALNPKLIQLSAETPATKPFLLKETPTIYKLCVEPSEKRIEGNYYFFVVYYELAGQAYNSYLPFFAEALDGIDGQNMLQTRAEYIKYLSSGNPNYGEYFTVFEPTEHGTTRPKHSFRNKSLQTPPCANPVSEDGWDDIIVPVVSRTERKDRKGAITVSYEVAHASELEPSCGSLLATIKAIHASCLLRLPNAFKQEQGSWRLLVSDEQGALVSIFSHEAMGSGRKLDRVVFRNWNLARLVFGSDGRWLISVIQQDIRFKSPGNGSLLKILCGKCSEEKRLSMIASSLANEVDGVYNDLLGKSTAFLEDEMLSDANLARSKADIAFSYQALTGIDTTSAYLVNYADLLRLLASLRSLGGDYFVTLLHPQLNFVGKRQNSRDTHDSTKLVSIFSQSMHQKRRHDEHGHLTMTSRVEGGMFMTLERKFITDENRGILCPFSREMKEVYDTFALFKENEVFMPLGLVVASGQQVSLSHLNQHVPLGVQFLTDGTMLPERARPFGRSNNTDMLGKLPGLKDQTRAFLRSKRFVEKLESLVASPGEFRFACLLASRLGQKDIFALLPYVEERAPRLDLSYAEQRVPRVYANVIENCSKPYVSCREPLFTAENILAAFKDDRFLSALDKVNGFILSTCWKKPTLFQHLALLASSLYARHQPGEGAIQLNDSETIPYTEAMWVASLGENMLCVRPTMLCENGDLLVRTLFPCMSQRSSIVQMLLAAKKWAFVMGNVSKNENSISTARDMHEVKLYNRNTTGIRDLTGVISYATATTSVGGARVAATFLERFAQVVTCSREAFRLKPERRKIIMRLLEEGEWESLLTLSLSKKEDKYPSVSEFYYIVNVQLKKSFVIDERVYRTEQYKTEAVEKFLQGF